MNRRLMMLSVLGLAAVGFATATLYAKRPGPAERTASVAPEMAEGLIRSYSPILGPKDAPVTIVEFFDPACEACRRFHPVVKDILAEHGDAVRVVLRYTPLHGEVSEVAIRVLEAARMQDKFEPVLEALMREQPRWASHSNMRPDLILSIAATAGLDMDVAQEQMLAPQTLAILKQDGADIVTVGVRQTPTFFVNGKPLNPFGAAELRALVSAEVAAAGS